VLAPGGAEATKASTASMKALRVGTSAMQVVRKCSRLSVAHMSVRSLATFGNADTST